MSKLKKAQSKTGKTGIVIVKEIEDDKAEEQPVRVIGGPGLVTGGRIKVKGHDSPSKRRKGPDSDSGK